jgi:hypothetical protein
LVTGGISTEGPSQGFKHDEPAAPVAQKRSRDHGDRGFVCRRWRIQAAPQREQLAHTIITATTNGLVNQRDVNPVDRGRLVVGPSEALNPE